MVFFVYFDPQVIETACGSGDALQTLTAVLRGFVQNCLLLDFEDWRGHTEIQRQLGQAPEFTDRSVVKKLFAVLEKRNRFLFCFKDDYTSGKTDLELVFDQATAVELDFILTEDANGCPTSPGIEVSKLKTYQNSQFEEKRAEVAANGRVYAGGEEVVDKFLDTNFWKALRASKRIHIWDKLFGERFGDNFEFTTRRLLQWLSDALLDPTACELVFHCGKPLKATSDHIVQKLSSFRRERTASMKISVQFYDPTDGDADLPHGRFIVTDQFAIEIERGMDFLDKKTERNRDGSFNLKDDGEIARVLQRYAQPRFPALFIP
ncbi:MAG: hypothetical protein FJ398_14125 [Verrucomicrobia bacterium]|nr:hypothetical protein [Verrucomicrobiota bacterium]